MIRVRTARNGIVFVVLEAPEILNMTGSYQFPEFQVIPQVDRASFRVGGMERLGYEFGSNGARPFLYPLLSSSGALLTRLGHPDPVGHGHHKSIWFGHGSVDGVNFWEERPNTDIRIRHRRVRSYEDGQDRATFAAELDWWAHGRSILHQDLTVTIQATGEDGLAIDLRSRFSSPHGSPVALGKTDRGFLGFQVAKTMSEQFGGGRLTNANGARGEKAVMGKRSRWVDYSGPSAPARIDGICFMDHPSNFGHPTPWHACADGWVGASFNRETPHGVALDHPLILGYRLFVHSGAPDPTVLDRVWQQFASESNGGLSRATDRLV